MSPVSQLSLANQVAKTFGDGVGVDLDGLGGRGADLSEANLTEADLNGARLSKSFLHKANLAEADLSGALLTGTLMPDGSKHA